MANHDQCTTVGDTFELDGPMVDDVKFLFCLGATPWADQTDPYIPLYPLTALVNEVYFVAGEILERYHALDAFGYQCTDYCQICKKIDQPKCLEDFEPHVIHYWDFAPFRWVRPIHDYGSIPAPIVIPIPMDGSGIFAHHNGVWFQGRTLVAPPVTWDIFSFSVDVWLKHYDTRNGNLIETTDPAPRSWSFGFVSPNLFFTLNGNTQNYEVAFDAPRMYNKWFIAQASVARVGLLESKI